MINGSYSFGANKINLENEITSFKGLNFKQLFKKTGIRYIYRTKKDETTLTLAIDASKHLLKNIDVVLLNEPDEIFPAFELAYKREDAKSTLIIEWGDYYNEK